MARLVPLCVCLLDQRHPPTAVCTRPCVHDGPVGIAGQQRVYRHVIRHKRPRGILVIKADRPTLQACRVRTVRTDHVLDSRRRTVGDGSQSGDEITIANAPFAHVSRAWYVQRLVCFVAIQGASDDIVLYAHGCVRGRQVAAVEPLVHQFIQHCGSQLVARLVRQVSQGLALIMGIGGIAPHHVVGQSRHVVGHVQGCLVLRHRQGCQSAMRRS